MYEDNDPSELKILILGSIILYFFKENVSLLARIFHTDRDEETAKADGVRRVMKSDDGCMSTYCPRKTSNSTQHPSTFPVSAVDEYEISGLGLLFRVGSSMVEQCPFKALVEGSSPSQPKPCLALASVSLFE